MCCFVLPQYPSSTWWHYVVEGERFDFALDGDMVVHKYSVSDVSGGWSFTSVLKS